MQNAESKLKIDKNYKFFVNFNKIFAVKKFHNKSIINI